MSKVTLFVCVVLAVGHMTQGRVVDATQGRVKRSDDLNPLKGVVDQHSARLNSLEAKLASLQHHAAFMAQFSQAARKAALNAPLKFDHVNFNDGNAYDGSLGVFIAPVDGVYIFSAQLLTHAEEWTVGDIYVNGNIRSRMAVDSHGPTQNLAQSELTTVVVKLQQGDKVWVQANAGSDFYGGYHSFFNGALLYTY